MQREQVITVLRRAAASGDDWFDLSESDDGIFQVSDASGGAAIVAVEEHWAEVRAGRSLSPGSHPIPALGPGSLLRVVVEAGEPPALLLRGRVYLDGFSLQSLYCTVRDVLQLAGPLPAAVSEPAAPSELAPPHAAEEPGDEAITELSIVGDEPPESGVSEAVDEAYIPVVAAADAAGEIGAEQSRIEAEISEPVDDVSEGVTEEGEGADVAADEPVAVPPRMDTPVAGTPLTVAAAATAAAAVPPVPPAAPTLTSSVGSTVQMSRAEMQAALAEDEPAAPATDVPQVCRRCGAQVEAGERFCINCGAPQPNTEAPSPPSAPAATDVPPLRRSTEPETVAWRRPSADAPAPPVPDQQPGAAPASAACGRCGYENPPGNRFCQGCGSALAAG